MRGKKQSEETKAKLSAAHRGMKHSEETKKKIGDAHRGKKLSEETKTKIADAKSKTVQALDKITGEVVFTFLSTAEAGRYGFNQGHVAACCRGEEKAHKGLIWRYSEK